MKRGGKPSIAVSEARGLRTLHIGGEAIQSAMRIAEPDALALDYTRCMMAFLLFHPEPREALMIGLGGGSLAKFFLKQLKSTKVRIVELDARIVIAARDFICGPLVEVACPLRRFGQRQRAQVVRDETAADHEHAFVA